MSKTPTGSTVVWYIQQRLRAAGHDIAVDGDLGPRSFWDNSETLNAILDRLGGPIELPTDKVSVGGVAGKRVFIDVGHGAKPGGFDPGAMHAPSGTTEHHLNLVGAHALRDILEEAGAEVTVNTKALGNYDRGVAAKGHDLLVSFHHNAAAGKAQYSLVAYDSRRGVSDDKALATAVARAVGKELEIKAQPARDMRLAVLSGARAAGVPLAILVEPYFMHAQTPANPPAEDMENWTVRAAKAMAGPILKKLGVNK